MRDKKRVLLRRGLRSGRSRRRLLRKAAEKQKLIETRGINAIEKRLDDPNLVDKIVEDLERKLGVPTSSNSSSDLPASSESIQVP